MNTLSDQLKCTAYTINCCRKHFRGSIVCEKSACEPTARAHVSNTPAKEPTPIPPPNLAALKGDLGGRGLERPKRRLLITFYVGKIGGGRAWHAGVQGGLMGDWRGGEATDGAFF